MSWWKKKYGKDSLCSITQARLRPGKGVNGLSYAVFLPCKHGFYRKALLAWIEGGKTTCPTCRMVFDPVRVVV